MDRAIILSFALAIITERVLPCVLIGIALYLLAKDVKR